MAALTSGTQLGSYEISDLLGKGGMGEVYRARDTKLGREVAIKVLPSEFAQDAERLARLEREARMLASLNHPNIAAIHGLEESDDTRFLVLELVEGDTIADRLTGGAIPVEESLKLALQIAEALEAAHEKGVIHRDLKPANIKVTPDGKVKVLDFGLAKAYMGEQSDVNLSNSPTLSMAATQQGLVLGTAAYMSPEQANGEVADRRADIWSFGVVLFEMLTGRPLFSGKTVSYILADVLRSEPDWTALPANLHSRVRMILERSLEKEARDRLSGISDARVEIQKALADPGGAVVQQAASTAIAGRASLLPWLAAVAAALLAGGAVWALRPAVQPGPVIRFPYVLPEDQGFSRPELSMVAVSPDGTKMAYVANGQIYLRNLNETEARAVDGTNPGGAGVAQPAFSPDGQWLAYIEVVTQTESVLKRVPVAGGTPVTLYDEGFQANPTWPTAESIVFGSPSGIVRIPANGGAPEILVERSENETFGRAQLLSGDSVLFSVSQSPPGPAAFAAGANIAVQTIGQDDRTVVWEGGADARAVPSGHLVYAQGNTLFAIPFDPASRTVSGGPVPIVEGVRRSSNFAMDTANYAISDTGTLVAIPGTAGAGSPATLLMLVERSGDRTTLDAPPAIYRSPRVSPDGRYVAVEVIDDSGQGHIWINDLMGQSAIRRLTQTGNNTRPTWTPDSQRVTFGSERDGSWGIFERPADGSTVAERLTTADEGRRHFPDSWSPDGNTLAYTDADLANAQWDVWTFDRDSGMTEFFVGGDVNQFSAVFSPDGEWLAYTSTTPEFGIYVQPFPQTGAVFQVAGQSEAAPVWTADGQELFFRPGQTTGESMQIMGLEVATAGGITFGNRQTLPIEGAVMNNGYRDFDIMPDGQQFVMVYPAEETDGPGDAPLSRIDVVFNWTQELLERVPVP